jgi:hypothetical protein
MYRPGTCPTSKFILGEESILADEAIAAVVESLERRIVLAPPERSPANKEFDYFDSSSPFRSQAANEKLLKELCSAGSIIHSQW